MESKDEGLKMMIGKMLTATLQFRHAIHDVEFSVFSQFGDDGIIQYLIKTIRPECQFFVEFGVENYLESNTRFLLQNNNWSGLVMDGNKSHIDSIKSQPFFWKHDLQAKAAFITAENINELLTDVPANAGLLHIDIDGNDYWVWKAITAIEPDIVIVEYNSVFGAHRAITVPYQPDFVRQKAHYSFLYAGASLGALYHLAATRGYSFVGSNLAGNNAYFVKANKMNGLPALSVQEGFVESKFRESRNKEGKLDFLRGAARLAAIEGLPVFNVITQTIEKL